MTVPTYATLGHCAVKQFPHMQLQGTGARGNINQYKIKVTIWTIFKGNDDEAETLLQTLKKKKKHKTEHSTFV